MRLTSLTRHLALVTACAGLSVAQHASAASILLDTFETYASQAAFEAAWAPIGTVAPQSGVLSTAQSVSPTHSVLNPGTATTGQSRNRRTFVETNTVINFAAGDKLLYSFDFYDSNGTNSPQRNYANLQDGTAPTATNQLIAMGLNNNQSATQSGGQFYMGRILGYTVPTTADPNGGPAESVGGAGAFFKLNDFGAPQRTTGWHKLAVLISSDDGLSTDYAFYVDGNLAELVSNVGTAASIRSYDNIALGSAVSNGSTAAYFDNVKVQAILAVPEPATMALAGLGLIGVVMASRRRAA